MTVAFRADADVTNGTAGTSVVVTKPTGTADGDVLIAFIGEDGNGSITAPAGWTLIGLATAGTSVRLGAYYKAAASEGASWTWTLGASVRNWGWVGAYTGVDNADPVADSDQALDTTAGTGFLIAANAVIPRFSSAVHAVATVRTAGGSATTWTANGTELADLSTNAGAGNDVSGAVYQRDNTTALPETSGNTFTASQSQTAGAMWVVALNPAFTAYDPAQPLEAIVEMAFGADPDGDPDSWSWTDVSQYVLDTPDFPGIGIDKGRQDENGRAAPNRVTLGLLNTDGRWTPDNPNGANYPNIVRNLPLRVSVPFGFDAPTERATVFADVWAPRWDVSLNRPVVAVTASGRLRRLQQAEDLRSAMFRTWTLTPTDEVAPVEYWPCEDGAGATQAANAVAGGLPMAVSGDVSFASSSGIYTGSDPLLVIGDDGRLTGTVRPYVATGQWCVVAATSVPAAVAGSGTLLEVRSTGTAAKWRITIEPASPDEIHLRVFDASGSSLLNDTLPLSSLTEAAFYGQAIVVAIGVTQNGADIDYALSVQTAGSGSSSVNTLAAQTHGNATTVIGQGSAAIDGSTLGHFGVYVDPGMDITIEPFDMSEAVFGHTGELPYRRFARLCTEEGIARTVERIGDDGQLGDETEIGMGPQPTGSLLNALYECEDADSGGIIYDGGDNGDLVFRIRDWMYNANVRLALDMDDGEVAPGYAPQLDDQGMRNDITVSRSGGSSERHEDTEHIAREGRYKQSVTLNLSADDHLADIAAFRVHRGTAPGMRFPRISFDLRRNPGLLEQWLYCFPGARMTMASPPSQQAPDTLDRIIEGYTESIRTFSWRVTANLSPASPFVVGVLDSDDLGKLDTAGSELAEDITTGTTQFDIATTTGPLWTTDDTEVPFDIGIGGERMTVTDVAASAPTFNATGTVAHAVNADVTPTMPSHITGSLLLCFAAIRNSGAGVPNTPTGYVRLPVFDASANCQLFARIAESGSEVAPTISFTGGVANADTSAQMVRCNGKWHDVNNVVSAAAACLNVSAQDINYPGLSIPEDQCIVIYLGWKQDDWTSVATIAGATEIGEPDTTTGDDQGIVWDRVIQTTRATIEAGVFTVTGGAAAISRGAVVALRCPAQEVTVTRSVNGVVKAHSAGAAASLWTPITLAL